MRLLCESLKLNHKTTTLDLHGGSYTQEGGVYHPVNPSFSKIGANCIGEMLQLNSTLARIDLHSMFIIIHFHSFSFLFHVFIFFCC